jgi:hypothetical protein
MENQNILTSELDYNLFTGKYINCTNCILHPNLQHNLEETKCPSFTHTPFEKVNVTIIEGDKIKSIYTVSTDIKKK